MSPPGKREHWTILVSCLYISPETYGASSNPYVFHLFLDTNYTDNIYYYDFEGISERHLNEKQLFFAENKEKVPEKLYAQTKEK